MRISSARFSGHPLQRRANGGVPWSLRSPVAKASLLRAFAVRLVSIVEGWITIIDSRGEPCVAPASAASTSVS